MVHSRQGQQGASAKLVCIMETNNLSGAPVLVVGAGIMGVGIAQVAAQVGHSVMLLDARSGAAEAAKAKLAQSLDALVGKGKMSEEDAKQGAMAALRDLRYSGAEYFWINDMQPKMVMHPIRPELEGKDLSGSKDPTGQPLSGHP